MRVTGPLASPNVIPDPVATVGNTVDFATGTVNVATLGILGALTGIDEKQRSRLPIPAPRAVDAPCTARPNSTSDR